MQVYLLTTGKVQGVGFRNWVRGVAMRNNVTGTVANLTDGSVEIYAQSEDEAVLTKFVTLVSEGSPLAEIEDV